MMRGLVRNMRVFYYALYESKVEIEDEYGNKTGEFEVIYGKPIKCKANISAAQGEMLSRQFGDSESYDKVITLSNVDIPINEYSILWVDNLPTINDEGTTNTPHDYIVKKKAISLNTVSLAISKVTVNG
jgi:hypothetical protein